MTEIAVWIGYWFMLIGGWLIAAALLGFLGWTVCKAWRAFSNMFRNVCRVESLIHEYRFHKQEFLEWKAERERGENDGCC